MGIKLTVPRDVAGATLRRNKLMILSSHQQAIVKFSVVRFTSTETVRILGAGSL